MKEEKEDELSGKKDMCGSVQRFTCLIWSREGRQESLFRLTWGQMTGEEQSAAKN